MDRRRFWSDQGVIHYRFDPFIWYPHIICVMHRILFGNVLFPRARLQYRYVRDVRISYATVSFFCDSCVTLHWHLGKIENERFLFDTKTKKNVCGFFYVFIFSSLYSPRWRGRVNFPVVLDQCREVRGGERTKIFTIITCVVIIEKYDGRAQHMSKINAGNGIERIVRNNSRCSIIYTVLSINLFSTVTRRRPIIRDKQTQNVTRFGLTNEIIIIIIHKTECEDKIFSPLAVHNSIYHCETHKDPFVIFRKFNSLYIYTDTSCTAVSVSGDLHHSRG